MTQENSKPGQAERTIAEVDRIRDIIFGPQMRLYEQQFKRMAGQLDRLGKQLEEMRAALDRQTAEQDSQARSFQEAMNQRLGDLERGVGSQIGKLESALEEQRSQARQLASDLRRENQELRAEIRSTLDSLEDGKAGREDLGDLLVEMGTRLKDQTGLADLLGQLEQAAQDQPED